MPDAVISSMRYKFDLGSIVELMRQVTVCWFNLKFIFSFTFSLVTQEALKRVKQLKRKRVFMERVLDRANEDFINSERSDDPCVKKVILLVFAER